YPGSAATSTRLSKNVAPAPRSVRVVAVVLLQVTPSGVSRNQRSPSVTTTPRRTDSPTTALAPHAPRPLKTPTPRPSATPRAARPKGLISRVGPPAARFSTSTLAKVEFKNGAAGGDTICSGYFAASSGRVCGSSDGGV